MISKGWTNIRQATKEESLSNNTIPTTPPHEDENKVSREVIEISPQPKIETEAVVEIETVEPEIEVSEPETPSEDKSLKCPHCNATSRTKASYDKNHGDRCIRFKKSKAKNKRK